MLFSSDSFHHFHFPKRVAGIITVKTVFDMFGMVSINHLFTLLSEGRHHTENNQVFQMATFQPKSSILQDFTFLPATEEDLEELLDFCVYHLPYLEPHSKVLGIEEKDARPFYRYILTKCLHYPYSMKVLERGTGALVGLRATSVANRDVSLDFPHYPFDWSTSPKNMQKLGKVVNQIKHGFWRGVDPTVNKVIRREISLVAPAHQRKGIARHMAGFGFDLEQLRREGIQGIVSEAFSIANQNLVLSLGFKCVFVPDYNWKNTLEDGTKTAMALFKDIRTPALCEDQQIEKSKL